MAPSGWLPGVFRELQHWVDPDARSMDHRFGTTFYARCGSPCLHVPGTEHTYADWPACPNCVLLHQVRSEWTDLHWGYGVLEHNVAHLAIAHLAIANPIPDYGAHARCGTWLIGPSPDPRRAAGITACSHCVHILTDQ